jgi:hypothetical protein
MDQNSLSGFDYPGTFLYSPFRSAASFKSSCKRLRLLRLHLIVKVDHFKIVRCMPSTHTKLLASP